MSTMERKKKEEFQEPRWDIIEKRVVRMGLTRVGTLEHDLKQKRTQASRSGEAHSRQRDQQIRSP